MTFSDAASRQYHRTAIYTVYLVSPEGVKTELGTTARKSGTGLELVAQGKQAQAILAAIPSMATAEYRKTGIGLLLSNGYRVEFGGTIRQEASR